jgi:hypothetical protein
MKKRTLANKKIAQALGSNRVVALETASGQGPLGLLNLREEIAQRLQSTGGRPSDPEWIMRRGVPFKPEVWERLILIANDLSTGKRKVTPAQVAAILVERELAKGPVA